MFGTLVRGVMLIENVELALAIRWQHEQLVVWCQYARGQPFRRMGGSRNVWSAAVGMCLEVGGGPRKAFDSGMAGGG